MLGFLRKLIPSPAVDATPISDPRPEPPSVIRAPSGAEFPLAGRIVRHHDLPIFDWKAVNAWLDASVGDSERPGVWLEIERAWFAHLRAALGEAYRIDESAASIVLSPMESGANRAMLDYMDRTGRRIGAVLEGIAAEHEYGKNLLVVFESWDRYYEYVTFYYPEGVEIAASGGMCINAGCGHFVTAREELRQVEPVIAHEMTHSFVGHLPLPLWLNEGIAVNTERRIAGARPGLYTPAELHEKHRAFWNAETIQTLWSGESFNVAGDSQMLSYELARIMVDQFGRQWEAFRAFVNAADREDSGAAAAHEHLGLDLGEIAAVLLEHEYSEAWSPRPDAWTAGTFSDTSDQPHATPR